jgi:hypothetical protein
VREWIAAPPTWLRLQAAPSRLSRLVATNFHVRRDLLDTLLAEDRARRGGTGIGA